MSVFDSSFPTFMPRNYDSMIAAFPVDYRILFKIWGLKDDLPRNYAIHYRLVDVASTNDCFELAFTYMSNNNMGVHEGMKNFFNRAIFEEISAADMLVQFACRGYSESSVENAPTLFGKRHEMFRKLSRIILVDKDEAFYTKEQLREYTLVDFEHMRCSDYRMDNFHRGVLDRCGELFVLKFHNPFGIKIQTVPTFGVEI